MYRRFVFLIDMGGSLPRLNFTGDLLLITKQIPCKLLSILSETEKSVSLESASGTSDLWNCFVQNFKGKVGGFKVQAVDATGAGDAFVGGLLKCLAADPNIYQEENKLREALLFANACGAITVTEKGAIPALPTTEAVKTLMSKA